MKLLLLLLALLTCVSGQRWPWDAGATLHDVIARYCQECILPDNPHELICGIKWMGGLKASGHVDDTNLTHYLDNVTPDRNDNFQSFQRFALSHSNDIVNLTEAFPPSAPLQNVTGAFHWTAPFLNVTAHATSGDGNSKQNLSVSLKPLGGSIIRATVSNIGPSDRLLYKPNTVLDKYPVDKVSVFRPTRHWEIVNISEPLDFLGSSGLIAPEFRNESRYWAHLAKGEHISADFDAAVTYNLSSGGDFVALASGYFFTKGTTDPEDVAQWNFTNSFVPLQGVDGKQAAQALKETLEDSRVDGTSDIRSRTDVLNRRANVLFAGAPDVDIRMAMSAISWVRRLSIDAAMDALDTPDDQIGSRFFAYFNTARKENRCHVANKLIMVAKESIITDLVAFATVVVADDENICQERTVSVYYRETGKVILCPMFYNFAALGDNCHAMDMATQLLHDFLHIHLVAPPAARDYEGHLWHPECKNLAWPRSSDNAQTYVFYAKSNYLACAFPY